MKIRKNFSFSIDDELYRKFELIAHSGGRTPNRLVAYIIRRTVDVYETAGCLDLLTKEKVIPRR